MAFLIRILILTASIVIIQYLFPSLIQTDGLMTAFVAAFVLALVNAVIRPLFILLTLPVTVITLGLFLLVINALMLKLAAYLVPGFDVGGLLYALIASILISIVSAILSMVVK